MVLFDVHLKGSGQITITTHYEAVTLCVTPGNSMIKGPNATVFGLKIYSRSFNGFFFETFICRGSGGSFRMRFEGGKGLSPVNRMKNCVFRKQTAKILKLLNFLRWRFFIIIICNIINDGVIEYVIFFFAKDEKYTLERVHIYAKTVC